MATGPALDVHTQPDAILVVIDSDFADALHQAARCALVPEALAAPAPIDGLAQGDRLRERLGVHVGMHEYFAGCEVRGNYGDQPVLIEYRTFYTPT